MKATFKLNGVTVVKSLPTCWAETTFSQFLKLTKCGVDKAKILSALTDIDEETLRKGQIANLETSQIKALTAAQLGAMSTSQIAAIETQDLEQLTAAQI